VKDGNGNGSVALLLKGSPRGGKHPTVNSKLTYEPDRLHNKRPEQRWRDPVFQLERSRHELKAIWIPHSQVEIERGLCSGWCVLMREAVSGPQMNEHTKSTFRQRRHACTWQREIQFGPLHPRG